VVAITRRSGTACCGGRDRADERLFLCAPGPASRRLREAGSPHTRRARSLVRHPSRRRSRGATYSRLRRRSLFSPRPGSAPRMRTAVRRARVAPRSASRPRRVVGFPRLPASVGCGGRSAARVLRRGCAACAPLPRSRRRWRRSRACASPRVCRFRSRRSRPARSRPRRGAVSAPRAGRSSRRLAARAPRRVLRPPWSRRVVVPVLGVAPRSRSAPSSPAPRAPRRSRRVARARSRACPRVSPCVPAVRACASPVAGARADLADVASRSSPPSRGRRAPGPRVARVVACACACLRVRFVRPRRADAARCVFRRALRRGRPRDLVRASRRVSRALARVGSVPGARRRVVRVDLIGRRDETRRDETRRDVNAVPRRARGRRTVTSVPDSSFAVGLVGLLLA